METTAVIKDFDEVENGLLSLGASLERAAIDEFLFEGAPEGFHGGIVIAAGFAAHGSQRFGFNQSVSKIGAGILAAAIGVKDQLRRRLAMSLSHVPCSQDELSIDGLAHSPADDAPAEEVHDASQIKPSFRGGDIGDVSDPDLIGSTWGGQLSQPVGSNGMIVAAVSGPDAETAPDSSSDALLAHHPGNAMAAMSASSPVEQCSK